MEKNTFNEENLPQFQEHYNEDRFWKKLGRLAGRLGKKVVYYILVLFYTLVDENTPAKYRAIIAGALGYFILPFDFIPDILPFGGMADDWAALLAAVAYVSRAITPDIKAKARLKLEKWFPDVKDADLGDLA